VISKTNLPPSIPLGLNSPLRLTEVYKVFEKMTQSLRNHNFATVRQTVMRFSAKCLKRNSLLDKSLCLYTAIKYSLFCSWQVKYLKTLLICTSSSLLKMKSAPNQFFKLIKKDEILSVRKMGLVQT